MRLGGPRAGMMRELLGHRCFHNIAHHQSASYATFSPKNYHYYRQGMANLKQKIQDFTPNFPRSVFACITVNFGPRTRTRIHTDAKNTAHGMCAVTALGNFDSKLGGHIVLWDLKVVLEFPSALLLHSNVGVQAHETCYSLTQYTAGGIWRWLDAGGRTESQLNQGELADTLVLKNGRRERAIGMFSTLEEIKSSLNPDSVLLPEL
ncbi:hypothetical protein K435DRAFT_823949 [Dendrothele bispora CBS 962.96]|uniref:Alpha-ketoglutarate-dependent dioxygenase AlkB-like domain-containing protein n=1 Tax=Dendrothele bispora (strain CBS 962.96) TaxID=1314807 RepID=A0A4S8KTS3_DENBC|nr:hypothetical protein K435DRAFT_823949 [Dendrothele bispora CBS 962.96]